jgi:hypothetical protein
MDLLTGSETIAIEFWSSALDCGYIRIFSRYRRTVRGIDQNIMETSTKRGLPSYSVGDIQPDKYKRKALDVPTCRCQSKHEVDHHCSKNRGNTLPGRVLLQFVDSPPKKQRLATTPTPDGYCSVCKIQHAM